jgi:methionyl-tRNA synthetase
MKKFYITTPLYYVNDVPHVGHAYSTIGADVLARFMRARGRAVVLQTGTDEHGQKIAKAAAEKGLAGPKELADAVAPRFEELWRILDISHDRFYRTTAPAHYAACQEFFRRVQANGYLEKRAYEGWYSVADETFWLESQLLQPGNLAPDSGYPCVKMKEENWFFLLSRLQSRLRAHVLAKADFIRPELRRNEVLGSYLNVDGGVQDISVTRSGVKWGIPVPGDDSQVLYVWFDALINYLAGTGWPGTDFESEWPVDVHIIGKDILRFHAVLWPGMLLAAGLPEDLLPRQVFGTGFIVNDGQKMSKRLGNVVDPVDWAGRYGADVLRYYLLREVPFGLDGSISAAGLEARYNAELANGLGNLLSRVAALCEKNAVRFTAWRGADGSVDRELLDAAAALKNAYLPAMEKLAFHEALEAINALVRAANKYMDERAPWTLAKDKTAEGAAKLAHVLYAVAEAARLAVCALAPFMPKTAERCLGALGYAPAALLGPRGEARGEPLDALLDWGKLPAGLALKKGEAIFPRREATRA